MMLTKNDGLMQYQIFYSIEPNQKHNEVYDPWKYYSGWVEHGTGCQEIFSYSLLQ